jgi:phosphatidylserine/phosphatidylglycerophosphate/cardiolipin synthase-like enzyme
MDLAAAEPPDREDIFKMLRRLPSEAGRPLSVDQLYLALAALEDLGIVARSGKGFSFNRSRFFETGELRKGIKATAKALRQDTQRERSHLCVSTPPSLSNEAEYLIREFCTDLRSELLDLISNASSSIIIASPFWDGTTSADLVSLLGKRAQAGVELTLLGRFSEELYPAVRAQLQKVSQSPKCRILSWFETSGSETETFHFKAISVDQGRAGYIGSANMTTSSLRSRMELGLILKEDLATQLDRVLRIAIAMAKPMIL